jgi:hypothetical protein
MASKDGRKARTCSKRCELRAATSLPLWVKLSPNTGEMPEVARAAEAAGGLSPPDRLDRRFSTGVPQESATFGNNATAREREEDQLYTV